MNEPSHPLFRRLPLGEPSSLRVMADQMREDAAHCWGIRRKMNLQAAARHLDYAATTIEELQRTIKANERRERTDRRAED